MFIGTGVSRGKRESSEKSLLRTGGGETTKEAIPEKIAHNDTFPKHEVGMFNTGGVAGSVVVTCHALGSGSDNTVVYE